MKHWLIAGYAIVALSPILVLAFSQYDGWRGILVPETTEWLCGKLGRSAMNPFEAASHLANITSPIWCFLTIAFGGFALVLGKLTIRPVLSLGLVGLLANAFALFGTGWMSAKYEDVMSGQCGIYG